MKYVPKHLARPFLDRARQRMPVYRPVVPCAERDWVGNEVSQVPVCGMYEGSRRTTASTVSIHERRPGKTGAHILRFIGIGPTEVIDQRATLFQAGTELRIILVYIETKKRSINRGGRIKHLHGVSGSRKRWNRHRRKDHAH